MKNNQQQNGKSPKCRYCNTRMEPDDSIAIPDGRTGEDIVLKDVQCWKCPKCGNKLASDSAMRLYYKMKQMRREEWIFSYIRSFKDITHYLYTRKQTFAYMMRKFKESGWHDKVSHKKHWYNWCLSDDQWYYFVNICGKRYYLKKCIWDECRHVIDWPISKGIGIKPSKERREASDEHQAIEDALFMKVHSFADIGKCFYSQQQATRYIKKHCPGLSPRQVLTKCNLYVIICGRKHYLRKSIQASARRR